MRVLRIILLCLALTVCAGENVRAQSGDLQMPRYDEPLLELNGEYRHTFDGDYKYVSQGAFAGLFSLNENNYLGGELGFGAIQLKPGSFADEIARQPFFFEPRILFRHYFTPPHVFVRPYFTASVGWIWGLWEYRNPVYVDGDKVTLDAIDGADAGGGLGVLFQLNENFHIFGELDGGKMFMDTETRAGVDNNFFTDTAYVGVKAGLSLAF